MITCTDELQTSNKPANKKSEPLKVSQMVWTKKVQKTCQEMDKHRKRKRYAAEFEDPRAEVERGKVQSTLEMLLPEMESRYTVYCSW